MRRGLAVAALAAAALTTTAPQSANAYFCVTWVHGICVGCGTVNDVYKVVHGEDLYNC